MKTKYSFNFKNLNKNIFLNNSIIQDKYIYVEFNKWACNHIAISNCVLAIKKKHNYQVIAYPENGFQYFYKKTSLIHKFKFFIGQKLGLGNFGIYKSFGVKNFLNIKKKNNSKEAEFIFEKLKKNIKSNKDILDLRIKNILVGDLIYDSFLKILNKETINVKDKKFYEFLFISIEYFLYWYYQFKEKSINFVISSQSVYLSSLPIRIGIFFNSKCLVANPERLYSLNKNLIFSDSEHLFFPKIRKNINKSVLKKGMLVAKKLLGLRFGGEVGQDLSYMSKSAFGKLKNKKVLKNNSKFKILIAPHAFSDAPHQLGNHLFTDYLEWLNFIFEIAKNSKFDWYIKCHPNYVDYFDNTINVVKKLVKKNKTINYIKPNTSHIQLIKEGINCVVTCHGTIGSEYPYFDIPVINASKVNPHINYKFNIHPKNIKDFESKLKNTNKIKLNIKKKDLLEYYFFKNIYFSNNWLFEDIKDLIEYSNGYKNIYTHKSYEYWIKKWSFRKQQNITDAIYKFIKSNDYMMTHEHYNKNIKDILNEYAC